MNRDTGCSGDDQGAQSLASLSRRILISGHPIFDNIFGMGSVSASSK